MLDGQHRSRERLSARGGGATHPDRLVDARVLCAAMLEHGATEAAFAAFDAKLCGPISQLILRNRDAGPFGLLIMVDERCGGFPTTSTT